MNSAKKEISPATTSVHQVFEAKAESDPNRIALICGERTVRYGALNCQANQLARVLRRRGIKPGDVVAVLMGRSVEMIVSFLAILKAGAAYLPLDPSYPQERIDFMVLGARARLILVLAREGGQSSSTATDGWVIFDQISFHSESDSNLDLSVSADALAYIMFTSGSTGQPKGVCIPHRGIVRLVFGLDGLELTDQLRFLFLSSPAFDASTFEIWTPLLIGAVCVVFPHRSSDIRQIGAVLLEHTVTVLWLTSSFFNVIINEAPNILRGLSYLLVGGEALSVAHLRIALRMLPTTHLINGYGPTEATTFSTIYPIPRILDQSILSVPIGRAIGFTEVAILDTDLSPVPPGGVGEIYIGGDGLALGYLNDPELTAQKFIESPFSSIERRRFYKSGDLGRFLPSGDIEFVGRIDSQVKVRGFRIELTEIEAALAQHPAILQAACFVTDAAYAQQRLIAGVIFDTCGTVPTQQELRHFLQTKLPEFMIPESVTRFDAFPVTVSGKLDRAELRRLWGTPLDKGTPFKAADNTLQIFIQRIWKDILDQSDIGIDDNFFDLGGDSLLATTMMMRIETETLWAAPLNAIYENPTIRRLSQKLLLSPRGTKRKGRFFEPTDGTGVPLFFLHGDFHGGGVFCYLIAKRLAPDIGMVAVHPHGLPSCPVPASIEDMAGDIAELLKAEFPDAPYHLAGHCNGALVAYELSRQLQYDGFRVPSVILIEPPDVVEEVKSFDPNLYKSLQDAINVEMRLSKHAVARHTEILRLYSFVCDHYIPQTSSARLSLIMASDNMNQADPSRGWGALCPNVDLQIVTGNHLSVLLSPSDSFINAIRRGMDLAPDADQPPV